MPNLPAHIELARRAAERLEHPAIDTHMGHYLLGSTSPDVRAITRRSREEYHFAPLDFESVGTGVAGLFGAHPELSSAAAQPEPLMAFIAGYITHLVADEVWIVDMYRPFFGNRGVFDDGDVGNVMDRALQLELDRQSWEAAEGTRAELEVTVDALDIGFIPPETLRDWQGWVLTVFDRGFSWERLKFMARRISKGDEAHAVHGLVREFIEAVPESLEQLYEVVPRRKLVDFQERAVEELVRTVGDYLQ